MSFNIKNTLKRISAFALASTMAISTPFQAFADGLSGNAGGSNNQGIVTSTGGDFGVNRDVTNPSNSMGRIGIRLSLVDYNNPSNVISVQPDGVTPRVVDLLYTSKSAYYGFISGGWFTEVDWNKTGFSSVKTQDLMPLNSANAPAIEWYWFDSVFKTNYYGQGEDSEFRVADIEPWIIHDGNSFNGTGEEFVDWSRKDNNNNVIIGEDGNLISTSFTINIFGIKTQVTTISNTSTGELTLEMENGLEKQAMLFPGDVASLSSEVRSDLAKLEGYVDSSQSFNEKNNEEAAAVYKDFAFTQAKIIAIGAHGNQGGSSDSLQAQFDQILQAISAEYPVFANGYNQVKEEYIRTWSEAAGVGYRPGTSIDANESLAGYNGNGATSSTTPVEGGSQNLGVSHIHQLLGLKDEEGNYLLQTPSMVQHKSEGWTLNDAEENWVLLVEPIVYLTICHAGSMGRASDAVYGNKLYGTVSNVMDALATMPEFAAYRNAPHFNWKAFREIWYPLHVSDSGTGYEFANGQYRLAPMGEYGFVPGSQHMPVEFEQANNWTADGTTADGAAKYKKCGFSVNVYWGKSGTKGRTWDEPTPEPAAPPAGQKVTPEEGIKVVKWYTVKIPDGDKTYEMVTDVIVDDNHPRRIVAENEGVPGESNFYYLEKWATGKDDVVPDQGDLDTTFEQYRKKNRGELGGTGPYEVIVPDNEKVLYLKLVQYDWLTPGEIDVVKVKEPSNGGTPIIEHDTTNPGTTYPAGNEDGWTYTEDIQTTEPEVPVTKWPDVPTTGTPGNTPDIPVRDDTETIYIHYTDEVPEEEATPPGTMILYQNELSYGYDLRDLTQNGVLAGLKDYFKSPKPLTTSAYCSGHWCSNHDTDHYRSATKKINDKTYSLSVSSSNTAPNFILDWAEKDGSWYLSKSNGKISSFYTSQLFPNADFILYRDRNQDLVTLYPGKNASTKGELSRMGITAESYTPATHRIGSTGSGKFYATYQTNFAHDSDYDNELSWTWRDSRGCTASGTWNSTEVEGKRVSDLNATYSNTNNTEFRYELGQANTASAAPSETIDQTFTNVFANNTDVTVAQDGKLDFYPYIKMKLNNKSNNASDVYVTSTNLSSMPAYTKIEAGLWKGNAVDSDSANGNNPTPNVNLTSTQWSTHASSLEFISDNDIDDKNSVLPGGAIFDVDMKRNSSAQWTGEPGDTPTTSTKLGYRIWQTCVPDELASALAPGSNAPTVSEAKNQVTAFDESVKNSVANYGLVQAVAKGITPYNGYLKNFVGDSAYQYAYNGAQWMNIALSEDTKYYLKLVAPNSGDGKLDTSVSNFGIHKGGLVTQIEYKVAADVDGNVTVYRNNTPIKTINKTQGVEVLLADAEIKRVDDATKAVTNFVAALDRNLGYDRQNATWYNEAFDGITVLYSYLSYDIGLGDGSTGVISGEVKSVPIRTAVQDTFLSGVLENRADLYNFKSDSENKVRSSMILTGEYTDGGVSYPSGNLGALATKNGTTMQITLPNMETFAFSKMWYIPNANVTDLN